MMSNFPPVPKSNRAGQQTQGVTLDKYLDQGAVAPQKGTSQGRLDEDETSFILQTTLLPQHADDPNILRFIAAYMRCRDTRQAAREAGLDPRSGQNLRTRPDIHQAIVKLTEKSVMKYGFDASEVIEKVKEIAAIDPAEFLRPDGSYITDMREIPPESRRAIKKFKAKNLYEKDPNGMRVQVGVLIEVEMWDKLKATEMLGREKELFKETKKIEHDVTSNMAQVLLESSRLADSKWQELHDRTPVIEITGKTEGVADGDEEESGEEEEDG